MLMRCRYRITQDGFKFQKLIGSRTIPFEEIQSIHLQEDCFALTTDDGEEFRTVESNLLTLLETVVRHNISYLDETDHEEKYYTREELKPRIEDATKAAREVANEYVKEHLAMSLEER